LEYSEGTWSADLVVDDPESDKMKSLLATGWHPQLITPDNAYVLLMQMTAIKVTEKKAQEALGAAEHEGSVRMADSGQESE
jgi:hypothetical protein